LIKISLATLLILSVTVSTAGCTGQKWQDRSGQPADVPDEYKSMYATLGANLDRYEAALNGSDTGQRYPVTFGAELLLANSNRGEALLAPQAMDGVKLYLDRLKELGVQGITVKVAHPIYTPDYPRYDEYVSFYKQVAKEVRARGMKLYVDASVLFAGTTFSSVDYSYRGVTLGRYEEEKRQMVAAILKDMGPDYIILGGEPDTEYALTGIRELQDPAKYAGYINYVIDGVDRGDAKLAAGMGSWGNLDFARELASNTSLDAITIHVYPTDPRSMGNIQAIIDIARQGGKKVIMDEMWLYKVEKAQSVGVAATADIFKLDAFGFWAPLDQRFLDLMVRTARQDNVEYISPFWNNYMFAYLDYAPGTGRMAYSEVSALANKAAYANIVDDRFSSTGDYYRELIRENSQ